MRLSINGWQPVASHLVCLIIGIAMSNILNQQVRASIPERGDMTFSIPRKFLQVDRKKMRPDLKANIYRLEGSNVTCRMFKTNLTTKEEGDRLIISTALNEQAGLAHLTRDLKLSRKVQLARDNQKVPLCRSQSKVSYGG